jgi:hypothetical protein
MKPRSAWLASALALAATAAMLAMPGLAQAAASATGARPSFAAQARGYGLSSTQVITLQREVNTYIARHGGKQAAINEVTFPGGSIVFEVPGQKYARPVTSAATARPAIAADCPYYHFCIYEGQDFTGPSYNFYYCKELPNKSGWNGSWKNDQTPGTKAELWGYNTQLHKPYSRYWTQPAYSNDPYWLRYDLIQHVQACHG